MEVECVYENGVLRPLKPVRLKEGERVKVIIKGNIIDLINNFGGIGEGKRKITSKLLHEIENEIYGRGVY